MSTENVMVDEENKLTDEQIEFIANDMEEFAKGTDLEMIANLPSNNGVDEISQEDVTEEGEDRKVMVNVNPITGEETIAAEDDIKNLDFDAFIEQINSGVTDFDSFSIDKDDFTNTIDTSDKTLFFNSVVESEGELKEENIEVIIDVMNRRAKGEEFNVYKALPEEVRNIIDRYYMTQIMGSTDRVAQISTNDAMSRQFKKQVAESIIDDYIQNIKSKKSKHDFADELANTYAEFEKDKQELADASVEYTEARNKAYREGADKIEDPEKRKKYLEIMDSIDEALNLTQLKEFAKRCKIKQIEIDKYNRAIADFLQKYEDSDKNIYNLSMVTTILFRSLKDDGYELIHIVALVLAFIKQVRNYKADVATEHAYMYYFIYYCVFIDNQKNNFKENIKEVINNLIERNSSLLPELSHNTVEDGDN